MKYNNVSTENGHAKLVPQLLDILNFVDHYMEAKYNYTITVTDTIRTQKEQDRIYKDNAKYKKKKFNSVHQYARGADISVKGMNIEMINDLVSVLNRIKYSDKYKTATHHDVGAGDHIHIQTPSMRCKQIEEV